MGAHGVTTGQRGYRYHALALFDVVTVSILREWITTHTWVIVPRESRRRLLDYGIRIAGTVCFLFLFKIVQQRPTKTQEIQSIKVYFPNDFG